MATASESLDPEIGQNERLRRWLEEWLPVTAGRDPTQQQLVFIRWMVERGDLSESIPPPPDLAESSNRLREALRRIRSTR